MKKREIERLIPVAINCIEEDKELCKNGKVPSEFNGYISSFGASIIQSGILATVTFYSNANANTNEDRSKIPKIIFNILKESNTIETNKITLKDYLLYENKSGNNCLLKAKEKVLNAAVALKLGIRVFEFDECSSEEKKDKAFEVNEKTKKKSFNDIMKLLKEDNINIDYSSEGNLSYLYYKDYFEDYINENFQNSDTYRDYYFDIKNEMLISNSKKDKLKSIGMVNSKDIKERSFTLKTTYPGFLIGSGYNHQISENGEFKLGFEFDYTSGLPIINGSSIKGVLRSVFYSKEDCEENNNIKLDYINSLLKKCTKTKRIKDIIEFKELTDEIFCGIKNDKNLNIYERDIFFNAVVNLENTEAEYILGEDYITPHKNPLKNPIPIKFLKVMPNVAWRFEFDLKNGILSRCEKLQLFKMIIMDLGVGAKTNIGYGALIDIEDKNKNNNVNDKKIHNEKLVDKQDSCEVNPDMLLMLKKSLENR